MDIYTSGDLPIRINDHNRDDLLMLHDSYKINNIVRKKHCRVTPTHDNNVIVYFLHLFLLLHRTKPVYQWGTTSVLNLGRPESSSTHESGWWGLLYLGNNHFIKLILGLYVSWLLKRQFIIISNDRKILFIYLYWKKMKSYVIRRRGDINKVDKKTVVSLKVVIICNRKTII